MGVENAIFMYFAVMHLDRSKACRLQMPNQVIARKESQLNRCPWATVEDQIIVQFIVAFSGTPGK